MLSHMSLVHSPPASSPASSASLSSRQESLETLTLGDWLKLEPFSLCLSSGFFGFFAHAGVISILEEEGLTPKRLYGSSAGALVSGLWASGVSATTLREALVDLDRADFWDPGLGMGLLKGSLFDQRLEELLGCERFEETRYPLSVTAFNIYKCRGVVFNQGPLAPAIRASCTFPGLFQPKWINGAPYLDGGITDRSGTLGISNGERVFYHHLTSRSRWRNALGLTHIPDRSHQVALCLRDLPRCGPHRLEHGPRAYEIARQQMRDALALPLLPRIAQESWLAQLLY